jgi:hypothetical protein
MIYYYYYYYLFELQMRFYPVAVVLSPSKFWDSILQAATPVSLYLMLFAMPCIVMLPFVTI